VKKLMSLMCATSSAGMVQRTTRAVAALALLTIPALVDAAPGPRNSGNSGPGKRIERSVPEPATLLLLGAAAGVAYGVRKLRSKRQ